MSTTGIIVEYNPLHNGHLYHIHKTKDVTGCSSIVAVMSGNFVQRGEPAILNKWARTEMALNAGVDLVLELPAIYSTSSAEGFAFGAVSTLNNTGIIDNLCFGSESGRLDLLELISLILSEEPEEYSLLLRDSLNNGVSYPFARHQALLEYITVKYENNDCKQELNDILVNSNNILGIEYLKSLYRLRSNIKPYTIARVNNKYNENKLTGHISSATAIRNNIDEPGIYESLPQFSSSIIDREKNCGSCPVTIMNFSDIILHILRKMDSSDIERLIDVGEGLENKIKRAAEDSGNVLELIENIKNKRYTSTRIQRILIYALLGITKDMQYKIKNPVEYIRVLGFNEKGKLLIKKMRKKCTVPIIINPSKEDIELLKYDILATDTYVLGYKNSRFKGAKLDLKIPPVIV